MAMPDKPAFFMRAPKRTYPSGNQCIPVAIIATLAIATLAVATLAALENPHDD